MDNLVKKLHLIKENPGYYNALSPEEQAELFIFLLTPKKKIFQKPVEIKGIDGKTPVKDVDYLSLEKTQEALAEIEQKVQAKLSEIRQPEDGKDAVITPEIIDDILGQVLSLVDIPEFVPYDDTVLTERIENAELDHAELRDEVDTLKKNITTQFVGGGVSANWVKNYVNSKTYSVSDLEGMDVATTGQVPTKQADGTWAPQTPTGGSGSGDVTGPASSTDNAITRFDGTTGKLIQNSNATVSDDGVAGVDAVQLDLTPTTTIASTGMFLWNSDEGTVDLGMPNGVTQQVGQEQYFYIKNQTGAPLLNGKAIMFAGAVGASGRLKGQYALADATYKPNYTMGVATQDIADGNDGYVTWFGKVRSIDTTGTPYGETWAEGDRLFVSPTIPGALTNIQPSVPNYQVTVAAVINVHSVNGTIFVRPTWRNKFSELDDVNGTPLTTSGQIAVWDQTNEYFDFTENINDKADKVGTADIEITDNLKGVIIKSANGTRFRIGVTDNGELTTTSL